MKEIIIFGYDEYAKEIALNFKKIKISPTLYLLDESSYDQALEDGYKAELVELDDDWLEIQDSFDINTVLCFCSLSNDSENVFLTISLRAEYPNLHIISLATSENSAQKLRLAGANKAIAKLETTAHIIVESLERPLAVKVMDDIIYHKNDIKMAEFYVSKASCFCNKSLTDVIQMTTDLDIIILALSYKGEKIEFSFSLKQEHMHIQEGSTFVFLAKEKAFEKLEEKVKGKV